MDKRVSKRPGGLLALYEANLRAQADLKEAQAEIEAAGGYLRSYISWSNVLNIASRAYQEATGCQVSYKEEQFRVELDAIFHDIAERFKSKRLEALPNNEMYADQIREVQDRIDTWLRDRRDKFMQMKQAYEETLKASGWADSICMLPLILLIPKPRVAACTAKSWKRRANTSSHWSKN